MSVIEFLPFHQWSSFLRQSLPSSIWSDIGLFMCTNMLKVSCYLCINFDQAFTFLDKLLCSNTCCLIVGEIMTTAFYHRHEILWRQAEFKYDYWKWRRTRSNGELLAAFSRKWEREVVAYLCKGIFFYFGAKIVIFYLQKCSIL